RRSRRRLSTPMHQKAIAVLSRPHKAQSLKQRKRPVKALDIDPELFSSRRGHRLQLLNNRGSDTGAPALWQNGYIQDPDFIRCLCQVQPSYANPVYQYHQIFRIRILSPIVDVLSIELHLEERSPLLLVPARECEFLIPRTAIHFQQERLILRASGPKAHRPSAINLYRPLPNLHHTNRWNVGTLERAKVRCCG